MLLGNKVVRSQTLEAACTYQALMLVDDQCLQIATNAEYVLYNAFLGRSSGEELQN